MCCECMQVQRQRFGAHLKRRYGLPELLGRHVGRIKRFMERWRMGEGNDEFQVSSLPAVCSTSQ